MYILTTAVVMQVARSVWGLVMAAMDDDLSEAAGSRLFFSIRRKNSFRSTHIRMSVLLILRLFSAPGTKSCKDVHAPLAVTFDRISFLPVVRAGDDGWKLGPYYPHSIRRKRLSA